MEHNFLPYLYKIKCEKTYRVVLRIILTAVILLNGVLLYIKLMYFNNKSLEADQLTKTKIHIASKNTEDKNVISLKTYYRINEIINENYCTKVVVNNNKADINMIINGNGDYEKIIKSIESNESIKILKICTLEGNSGSDTVLQISLEMGSVKK